MAYQRKPEKPMTGQTGSYSLSDLDHVYSVGTFNSWQDLISWLDTNAGKDSHITADKANMIKADIQQLMQNNTPFVDNAHRVYDLIHHLPPKTQAAGR